MALTGEPSSRAELLEVLRASEQRELLDAEALSIIEGALTVSDLKAREIMVPRSQVVFFRIDQTAGEILTGVIESGHSQIPCSRVMAMTMCSASCLAKDHAVPGAPRPLRAV
jgi:magnesium and cobalt transporter